MAALGAAICNALSGWVEAQHRYPSLVGLDDRRQATGRDSGECPKTVTHVTNCLLFEAKYFQSSLRTEIVLFFGRRASGHVAIVRSTMALKPRADVTQSPTQDTQYQWPC